MAYSDFYAVRGFAPDLEDVQYALVEEDGNELVAWTNEGIVDLAPTTEPSATESVYGVRKADMPTGFTGVMHFRDDGTTPTRYAAGTITPDQFLDEDAVAAELAVLLPPLLPTPIAISTTPVIVNRTVSVAGIALVGQHDTLSSLEAIVFQDDTVESLTGWSATFSMQNSVGETVIDEDEATLALLDGIVRAIHDWSAEETAIAGRFQGRFRITNPLGNFSAPNDKSIDVRITEL